MSAFALPHDRQSKSDPALISEDERHFAAIARSMEHSIADASMRLAAVQRFSARMGQEAVERDLEVHRLTERLRSLRRFGLDVCLGHMVAAATGEVVYIGRVGLLDESGNQLSIDWRSPAAEPFFGATHANPMGVARRRRYRWTRGQIVDYWDEVFRSEDHQVEQARRPALDDQSAFIASLGSTRSTKMHE